MTRKEWKKQAEAHCAAAKTLLQKGHHSAAYHLAGLAVECALKAKIAASFKASTWPSKAFVLAIHTHSLEELVKQAGLKSDLKESEDSSAVFRTYWKTAKEWTIDSRYKNWTPTEAKDMVQAVSVRGNGILAWIKKYW